MTLSGLEAEFMELIKANMSEGVCRLSNRQFIDATYCNDSSVNKILKQLEGKSLITRKRVKKSREIRLVERE